jgi:hypothetical protein
MILSNYILKTGFLGFRTYSSAKSPHYSLNWTGSKAALVELIYALQAQGVLDHGHADIKQISRAFSRMFNVDLGDFYHTYLELRNRKKLITVSFVQRRPVRF